MRVFVFQGMCESCVAPLLILLISMFYKKNEQVNARLALSIEVLTQELKASRISWFYVMVRDRNISRRNRA